MPFNTQVCPIEVSIVSDVSAFVVYVAQVSATDFIESASVSVVI